MLEDSSMAHNVFCFGPESLRPLDSVCFQKQQYTSSFHATMKQGIWPGNLKIKQTFGAIIRGGRLGIPLLFLFLHVNPPHIPLGSASLRFKPCLQARHPACIGLRSRYTTQSICICLAECFLKGMILQGES